MLKLGLVSCLALSTAGCSSSNTTSSTSTHLSSQTKWSVGRQITDVSDGLVSISCPAPNFCQALADNGDGFTYSAGRWSSKQQIDPGADPTAISCSSSSFCAVVDPDGNVYTSSHGNWTRSQHLGSGGSPNTGGLVSISRPTSTYCVAVSGLAMSSPTQEAPGRADSRSSQTALGLSPSHVPPAHFVWR
jgi:hypothetical protein